MRGRIVRVQKEPIRNSVSIKQKRFCAQHIAGPSPFLCPVCGCAVSLLRGQMLSPSLAFASTRTGALVAHGTDATKSIVNKRRLGFVAHCASAEGAVPSTAASPTSASDRSHETPPTPLQRVRSWFFGGKLDKERLKSLGFGALIAYGCASIPAGDLLSVAQRRGHCIHLATVPGPLTKHASSVLSL